MKKIIIISSVIAAVLLAALILALTLGGGNTGTAGTQATAGSTAETTGTGSTTGTQATAGTTAPPDCALTGRGHVYAGGVCGVCGAPEPTSAEYLKFRLLDDGTYSVGAKWITELPARLIIPETYEGKPVTVIRERAFIGAKNLKYIYIPEGIKTIEDEAFFECFNAEEIILPKSLENVGVSAFADCDSITEITFRGELTVFDEYACMGCDNLKTAVIEGDVMGTRHTLSATFMDCKALEIVVFEGEIKSLIEDFPTAVSFVFHSCESLKSVTFPKGLNTIGGDSFSFCKSLETLAIPASVNKITENSFVGCEKLSLSAEGENETYDITAHRIVEKATKTLVWQNDAAPLPNDGSILHIGNRAFSYNTYITEYTLPSFIETVGSEPFSYCTNLEKVTWACKQAIIPQNAFANCEKLETIEFETEITGIDWGVFISTALKSFEIPKGVKTIRQSLFEGCTALESVVIHEGVTVVGANAFYSCRSLKSITLPKGITSIGQNALAECPHLTDIYYGGTVEEWGAIRKFNLKGAVTVHCTDGDVSLL